MKEEFWVIVNAYGDFLYTTVSVTRADAIRKFLERYEPSNWSGWENWAKKGWRCTKVDYRPFKKNRLIRKKDIDIPCGVNNYGMTLKVIK